MRTLFWVTVLFASAVGLALLAHFDPGNVVLLVPPYRIDVSLNVFVLGIAALFVVLYLLLRMIATTLQFPERVRAYRERVREHNAREGLRGALLAHFEGRFSRAARYASEAQEVEGYAALAALVAARASHRMREFARRDGWLRVAAKDTSVRTARLMTQAELLLEERRADEAQDIIRELHASGARHVASMRLALNAAQQLEQWDEVLRLVRQLGKRDAIHPALAAKTKALAYGALMERRHGDASGMRTFWNTVPSADRTLADVAEPAARAFASFGEHAGAVAILDHAIEQNWNERLITAYAEIGSGSDRLRQIQHAEDWLDLHPQDAALLTTLGKLCAAEELWGKALDYLERSLRIEATPATLLALAELHERNGDQTRANALYRQCARRVRS